VRFLADESCDMAVVRALQGAGCDVVCIFDVLLLSKPGKFVLLESLKVKNIQKFPHPNFGYLAP